MYLNFVICHLLKVMHVLFQGGRSILLVEHNVQPFCGLCKCVCIVVVYKKQKNMVTLRVIKTP